MAVVVKVMMVITTMIPIALLIQHLELPVMVLRFKSVVVVGITAR